MHELNIQTICAETSPAKGRVERAHLTLQDRLVKELRLQGICSMEAANDFAEAYMADYNRRFGKVPRHDFDVHRAVEHDEDTGLIFTVREKRKVSKSLTIQYDKMLYLIEDSELSRRAIGKYIDVYHYPDGRKELRLNGTLLPYSTYDRLSEIDRGAIVDNKRLGRTTEFISLVQSKRDNTRSQSIPLEMALPDDGQSRKGRNPSAHWIMMTCSKHSNSFSHVQRTFLVKSPLMVLTGRTVVAHQLILSGQTHDVLFISFSIFMSCFSRAYLPHNE